jgi:hypothetical protein
MPCALLVIIILIGASGCTRLGGELSTSPGRMARQVAAAMGGERAFRKMRYLRFDFVTLENGRVHDRRSHLWDKRTGRYRLETQGPDGFRVVLMNVKTRDGAAFLDARPVPQESQRAAVEEALAWHDADTWWLAGGLLAVQGDKPRTYAGERQIEGKLYPTLEVGTDFAPDLIGDVTWFHVDRGSHLPVAWSFAREANRDQPTVYFWTEWTPVAKLTLPTRFKSARANREVAIEKIYAPGTVDMELFDQPYTITKH